MASTMFVMLCLFAGVNLLATFPTPDQDIASLNSQILQLQQTVSSLQSQSQTQTQAQAQAQNTAVVLSSVLFKLSSTEHELKSLKNDSKLLKLELIKDKLENVTAELTNMSTDVETVQSNLNHVSSELAGIHQLCQPNSEGLRNLSETLHHRSEDIAFMVSETGNSSNNIFSNGKLLKFNTLNYNHGNAYNTTTGIFTAPVSGTYFFWVNIGIYGKDLRASVYIQTVGKRLGVASGYTGHDEDYDMASGFAVGYLGEGETVWFAAKSDFTLKRPSTVGGALLTRDTK